MDREYVIIKVNTVVKEKLLIDLSGLSDDERDISLLSTRFGVKPRDLVAIFKELEDAFNIKFTKEDIMDSRFDIYNNIIDSIMKQVS